MKKVFQYFHNDLYLELLCALLFILSFCFEPIGQMFAGYGRILTNSSILLTDYVYIGGVGATLWNVATVLLFNLILIKVLKIKTTGPVYCGIIMICGFSFFGKNILNTLPIYFGIWLFSRYKRLPFSNFIISILFSTGISPLVSYAFFGFGLQLYFSIPLGIVCGAIVGFIIPAYTAHTITFHEGYNLYNTGFALGVISAIFYGVFNLCGLTVTTSNAYDNTNSTIFYVLLAVLSLSFILIAIIGDSKVFKKYFSLLKTSGRLITDYLKDYGVEAVMLNFGILGLFLLIICACFQIPLNGILFGSILAILGCAAFGLHIRNAISVWIGCALAILVLMAVRNDFSIEIHRDINTLVAFIFASGLAPIAGKYGPIYGIVGGFMHIVLSPLMISLQGGFDLYNNGFSAGFEASILAVCAETVFKKRRKPNAKQTKDM